VLICIDGIDGSGKSTQAKLLADSIQGAVLLKFPAYETPVGQAIQSYLRGEVGWMLRDPQSPMILRVESDLSPDEILAATEYLKRVSSARGFIVLEPDASIEQAGVAPSQAEPLALQALMTLNRLELVPTIRAHLSAGRTVVLDRYWPSGVAYGAADGLDATWLEMVHELLPQPDLMLLVDLDPKLSVERRPERADAYEADQGRLERAHHAYMKLWQSHCLDGRWHIIEGDAPLEQVQRSIWNYVDAYVLDHGETIVWKFSSKISTDDLCQRILR